MNATTRPRVTLEPVSVAHAGELFPVLAEAGLYAFIADEPPTSVEALRQRLSRYEPRKSPDGSEHWLNWVVRDGSRKVAGYVQATITANFEAIVAYVMGSAFSGRGIAGEAVSQMIEIIAMDFGVKRFVIVADRENRRSIRLAERLGFSEVPSELAALRGIVATDLLLLRTLP